MSKRLEQYDFCALRSRMHAFLRCWRSEAHTSELEFRSGNGGGNASLMVVITTEHSFLPSPESKPPPASLVAACMGALERSRDARFLVPALAGLSRQEAFLHLPKLLSLKDPAGFTAGMQRLLLPQPATGALAHVQTTLINTTVHSYSYSYCYSYC